MRAMDAVKPTPSNASKYIAEFIGTFILVFTVGNNVLGGSPVWAATSIACSLMVGIYALGPVSGANFNPAVSLALFICGKLPLQDLYMYIAMQLLAGFVAGISYGLLHWQVFEVAPAAGYSGHQACVVEFLYTFVLCFVVLNTAASKKDGGNNEYFGLAIGFVIVAGGYAAGHISGACFNPAVAFAIDVSSYGLGFWWCLPYAFSEFLGAVLAAGAFKAIRREENSDQAAPETYDFTSRALAEFIGTYVLVLTVGLNVLGGSPAPVWSIAAALMCMIFALGSVSGAHFNPAVSFGVYLSGENKYGAERYIPWQVIGGLCGAFTYAYLENGNTFPLAPGKGYDLKHAIIGEATYTFFLVYIVLCITCTKNPPCKEYFGLAIGSSVTAGGYAIGAFSGGALNPAVSFAISTSHLMNGGGVWPAVTYAVFEMLGAAIAVGAFKLTHPPEAFSISKPESGRSV